jgi:hypothetical protein
MLGSTAYFEQSTALDFLQKDNNYFSTDTMDLTKPCTTSQIKTRHCYQDTYLFITVKLQSVANYHTLVPLKKSYMCIINKRCTKYKIIDIIFNPCSTFSSTHYNSLHISLSVTVDEQLWMNRDHITVTCNTMYKNLLQKQNTVKRIHTHSFLSEVSIYREELTN